MRGAERPAKVKWTRPFLPPLEPLDPSASRQTFIEIADEPSGQETEDLDELLKLSGNLPLAVRILHRLRHIQIIFIYFTGQSHGGRSIARRLFKHFTTLENREHCPFVKRLR
jgi:hypothetical protein